MGHKLVLLALALDYAAVALDSALALLPEPIYDLGPLSPAYPFLEFEG